MAMNHVSGKHVADVTLYALSTCPWCRKAKVLLDQLGVEYSYADVDLADESEKEQLLSAVRKWNPSCSFPTLVINETKCIIGFKETEIREALKA